MLNKVHNFIQATDFRKNFSKYLKVAKNRPLVISTERGGKMRVVMNSVLYNKLLSAYEDQIDAVELNHLVNKDSGERILWRDLKKNVIHY